MIRWQSRPQNRPINWIKGLAALLAITAPNVLHASGLRLASGAPAEIASMLPGDQHLLNGQSSIIEFAGRKITLDAFTGIIGYASDVAYIVTISGSAMVSDKAAKRGRILILPPFGVEPSVGRFDAARLAASWEESDKSEFATAFAELQTIAKSQSRGIFLGSLGRTSFNVAASGEASQELAKRSIFGGAAMQGIRFSEFGDTASYEKEVVTRFTAALVDGDVDTVAQLMDPLPFGLSDMRGEPGDARNIAAQRLIYAHNWTAILTDAAPQLDAETGVWTIAGASPVEITLRNTADIPFIKSIRIGG